MSASQLSKIETSACRLGTRELVRITKDQIEIVALTVSRQESLAIVYFLLKELQRDLGELPVPYVRPQIEEAIEIILDSSSYAAEMPF